MKTIYLDRSRIQDELECKRLRYLRYDSWNGTDRSGIEPAKKALPLVNGGFVHETLEEVRKGASLQSVLEKQKALYQEALGNEDEFLLAEQLCLLEGLVTAWTAERLPLIESEYELVLVEQEVQWVLHEDSDYKLVVMLKCDTLERSRQDGELYIREYKTTGESDKTAWAQRFERSSQLICNILGMGDALKVHINGALIEGLDKGFRMKDRAQKSPFVGRKIQSSPLCYGYKSDGVYSTGFNKGAQKVAAWLEMPPGEWAMKVLTSEERQGLFYSVPPISFNEMLLNNWREQTIAKELKYARMIDDPRTLNTDFPQNLNHCRRFRNNPCPYEPVCFSGVDELSHLYRKREPHHLIPAEEE